MTSTFTLFTRSLFWNAFSFFISKIATLSTTYLLYTHLSGQEFSLWAQANAYIFLILLLLDGGLRKSIPLFSTQYPFIRFTHTLIMLQLILIGCSIPILYWYILPTLPAHTQLYTHATIALFTIEGVVSILRLIFHASFWNKEFNLLYTLAMALYCTLIILAITTNNTHMLALYAIAARALAILLVCITASTLLIYKKKPDTTTKLFSWKPFAIHTTFMWICTLVKAISERNALLPLFTATWGYESANIFKIAHDAALLFEQGVTRTIGISDTALLAHTDQKQRAHTTSKLIRSVMHIAILTSIAVGIYTYYRYTTTTQGLTIFLLCTTSYLITTTLSPYERILEVQRRYSILALCMLPYLIAIPYIYLYIHHLTIPSSLIIIHAARLISALLHAYYASTLYKIDTNISKH